MACPVAVHPHHVGIFVSDLDRACAWWEEMLGFQKMFENTFFLPDYGNARMAWIKKDDFYIELYDFPGLETGNSRYWKTYGTKHVSLWVKDGGDFDTLRDYLKEKGVPVVVEAVHTGRIRVASTEPEAAPVASVCCVKGSLRGPAFAGPLRECLRTC